MADNFNDTGDLDQRTATFAAKRLLERAQENMILERFGMSDPQAQNKGKVRTYRRYNSFPPIPATAPLAEGQTPTAKKITYTDVSVTLETYGELVEITREVKVYHEDPVFKQVFDALGEQQAEVIELIRWNALKAGTNVFYANGAASRSAVNSPAKLSDLKKVSRGFRRNRAKKITKIISATAMVATEPIKAAFIAIGHTDLLADLEALEGWTPVCNYSSAMKAMPNEEGFVGDFRVLLSDVFEPWEAAGTAGTAYLSSRVEVSDATACDVYPLVCLARDAYAMVPLQGLGAVTPSMLLPKKAPGDPMGRVGSVCWEADQACVILTQTFIARLEVACSATPPTGE